MSKGSKMSARDALAVVVAAILVFAGIAVFSDRSAFAWTLGLACVVGLLVGARAVAWRKASRENGGHRA